MAGNIELGFAISKEAMKLVKAGEATISSGGVRSLNGQLLELAKPVAKAVSSSGGNPALASIKTASALAENVQLEFLQHSVDIANRNLTTTIKKLELLQNSIGTISSLSWVNCALGMVNCGISIVGFKKTLDSLNNVSHQIQELSDKIDNEIMHKLKSKFKEFCMQINADMAALEKDELTSQLELTINQHIVSIIAYLEELIERFERNEIDRNFGCNALFSLAMGFCQEVKEYTAQYYYVNNAFPPNYSQWINVLEIINGESFKQSLKQYLLFETDTTMEQKYFAFNGAMLSIESKLEDMDFHKELIQQLTLEQFRNTDRLLSEKIRIDDVFDAGDLVYIPISAA